MKRWKKWIIPGLFLLAVVQFRGTVYAGELHGHVCEMEQEEAIRISEQEAEEWNIAEKYWNASDSETAENEEFLNYGSDYGYEDMKKRSNSAGRRYLYQQLKEKSREFSVNSANAQAKTVGSMVCYAVAEIDVSAYAMSENEKIESYFTFRHDNPQFFWLSNRVVYSENKLIVLTYDEYAAGTVRKNALNEIVDTAGEVYRSQISESDSDYEKVRKIHDTLISDIEYSDDTEIPVTHSIAGAMTSSRKAVCEGYSKVMQLMMNCYGINNIYVTGMTAGGGHAWNMVELKGQYYWLDATWDDQEEEEFQHDYFLVGNENFQDHETDVPEAAGIYFLYALPAAAETDYTDDTVIVKGDINRDGKINLTDIMLCMNNVSKKIVLTGDAADAADINDDGKVNITDLLRLVNYVSKKNQRL